MNNTSIALVVIGSVSLAIAISSIVIAAIVYTNYANSLTITNGGTGATSFTNGLLLVGNGTNSILSSSVAASTITTLVAQNTFPAITTFSNGLDSTSPATGTVVIGGGLGVAKNITTNEGITLPTVNGVPALLSNYEIFKFNTTLTGNYSSGPQAVEFLITVLGNTVIMAWPNVTGTATGPSTSTIVASTLLPARFRSPGGVVDTLVPVTNTSVNAGVIIGVFQVAFTGQITIFASAAFTSFATTGIIGINNSCTSWTTV
jgi:hypothetical protein